MLNNCIFFLPSWDSLRLPITGILLSASWNLLRRWAARGSTGDGATVGDGVRREALPASGVPSLGVLASFSFSF